MTLIRCFRDVADIERTLVDVPPRQEQDVARAVVLARHEAVCEQTHGPEIVLGIVRGDRRPRTVVNGTLQRSEGLDTGEDPGSIFPVGLVALLHARERDRAAVRDLAGGVL